MLIKEIEIKKIKLGKRFRHEEGDLSELVHSIQEKGVLQPITVDVSNTLVTGGRRIAASLKAGLKTIPCIVRKITDELDLREIELMENICRKDMTWQERARLEQRVFELRVMKDPKWSLRQQAGMTDTSKSAVARRIELAKALDVVPELASATSEDAAWKTYGKLKEEVVIESLAKKAKGEYKDADEHAGNHYNIGDAFKGMEKLNAGAFNFAEVDPPYAIELDKRKSNRNKKDNTKAYREVAEEDYGKFVKDMARLVFRALKSNSFCVWWYAAEWDSIVREELEEVGFQVNPIHAIWYKGQQGQTSSPDTMLASSYEPFYVCRKGLPKLAKAGRSNVFDFAPVSPLKKIHPTERPVELMGEILDTFSYPGAAVIVPFLGSGSTLRACYKRNMIGFGWDLDDTTKHRFLNRVKADRMGEENDNQGLTD